MEANQNQGAPASGEGTEASNTESAVSLAERLYPKEAAEEQANAEKEAGEGEQTEGKDTEAGVTAEPYNLRLPSGVIISDATLMTEFTQFGRERGLTDTDAQRLTDWHLKASGEYIRQAAEYRETYDKRVNEVDGWGAEFQSDPYFGGAKAQQTLAAAKSVLNTLGTPAEVERLKVELNKTGLGSHPVLIRGLAKLSRLLGDKLPSNKEKTLAQRLYPNLD